MPTPNPITTQRNRLGLSQAELARRSGITSQRIWQLESGMRDPCNLTVSVAMRLAKALETTVDKLFKDQRA